MNAYVIISTVVFAMFKTMYEISIVKRDFGHKNNFIWSSNYLQRESSHVSQLTSQLQDVTGCPTFDPLFFF